MSRVSFQAPEPLKESNGQIMGFSSVPHEGWCVGGDSAQCLQDTFWLSPSRNRVTQEFENGSAGSELARSPPGSRMKMGEDDQAYW